MNSLGCLFRRDQLVTVEVLDSQLAELAAARHVLGLGGHVHVAVIVLDSKSTQVALLGLGASGSGRDQCVSVVVLNTELAERAHLTVLHVHVHVHVVVSSNGGSLNVAFLEVGGDRETLLLVATDHTLAHEIRDFPGYGLRDDLVLGLLDVRLD